MADYVTGTIAFGSRTESSSGLSFEAFARVNFLLYTGTNGDRNNDGRIFDLGASIGQSGEWARLRSGIVVRIPDNATFLVDKEVVLIKFEGDFLPGIFRPGIKFVTTPTDDYYALTGVRFFYGFSMSILFRQ